jgi:hypothetical protein
VINLDSRLEELIEKNSKKENEDLNYLFSKYKITTYAKKKIQTYADRIAVLYGEPIEVLGFNTAPINSFDNIHYGAVLALNQTVSNGLCDQNSLKSYFDTKDVVLADGKKIVGWWHSHGEYLLSPSPKDKDFFRKLVSTSIQSSLLKLKPDSKIIGEIPYKIIKSEKDVDKKLIISSNEYFSKNIVLTMDDFKKGKNFKVKDIRLETFRGMPFSQMYIVNALNHEPYREFGIIDINNPENDLSNKDLIKKRFNITYIRNPPIEVLNNDYNKKIDINKIDEELKNQVYVDGKLLRDIVEKKSKHYLVPKSIEKNNSKNEFYNSKHLDGCENSLEQGIQKASKDIVVDLAKNYSTEEIVNGLKKNSCGKNLTKNKTKSQNKSLYQKFIDFFTK